MPTPTDFAIDLDTNLEAAVAQMEARQGNRGQAKFALGGNRFHRYAAKAKDRRSRAGIKKLIRPENAAELVENLPLRRDDRTHCVLRGDFVLCDLIPQVIARRGRCPHLRIATLGMSSANAATLATLVTSGDVQVLTIVVSHYFQQLDKATTFRDVQARLRGLATFVVTRSHAKVILLPTASGDSFVFEGSANLRSSDNLEQMVIVNDADAQAFHAAWIDELRAEG